MSEMQTEQGISREEFSALTKKMDALGKALEDLQKASTPSQRQAAEEDVDTAEYALKRYAEARGITMEEAEEAMNAIQRNNQKRAMREIMEEIYAEDEAAAEAAAKAAADEKAAQKGKNARHASNRAKEEVMDDGNNEDTGPSEEHWSERRLFQGR